MTDGLYRTILSSDGRSVLPESDPPVLLSGDDTLDIAQGPDGSLFDTRYLSGAVYYYQPFVVSSSSGTSPTIYSIYPRRGPVSGGTTVTIYGVNVWSASTSTKILLGGQDCSMVSIRVLPPTFKKIQCVVPKSEATGTVHIVVTTVTAGSTNTVLDDSNTATFQNGYRYISGGV
jgi:hypothetical protein